MHRIIVTALATVVGAALITADEKPRLLRFDKADLGKVPAGWKAAQTGQGSGVWKVVADDTAPSKTGHALAQTAADRNALFNLCVVEDGRYRDVEVSVAFKAVKGGKDQGGGVVWRFQDANNYYVARMNPLEDNFRVYKVVDGRRFPEFQSADVKVPAGEWHMLKVVMKGDHIECYLDGKKHLDVKDDTIKEAGKVGLWTKADAQTNFDDLRISGE
jgi:hypothetical protein